MCSCYSCMNSHKKMFHSNFTLSKYTTKLTLIFKHWKKKPFYVLILKIIGALLCNKHLWVSNYLSFLLKDTLSTSNWTINIFEFFFSSVLLFCWNIFNRQFEFIYMMDGIVFNSIENLNVSQYVTLWFIWNVWNVKV